MHLFRYRVSLNSETLSAVAVSWRVHLPEPQKAHCLLSVDLLSAVQNNQTLAASTELDVLEKSLKDIIGMIDRVLAYVQSVTSGQTAGDERIGRKLLDSLSSSVEGLEKDNMESLFTSHLQVCNYPERTLILILKTLLCSGHSDGFVPQ